MKKIEIGDIVTVIDTPANPYHGKVGKVVDYIHPYIYVVSFPEETESDGWFMAYQIVRGTFSV